MRQRAIDWNLWIMAGACALVGVLASRGTFSSINNFPLVFAGVCLVLGLLRWRRSGDRRRAAAGIVALVLGATLAGAGWWLHQEKVRRALVALQAEVAPLIEGRPAPVVTPVAPLNVDRATLAEAASFEAPATILSFWATWCSPCWAELRELQDLHERHHGDGLRIVALTRFDHPEGDEEGRASDVEGARRFLERRGHRFPAAITDSDRLYDAFEVRTIPTTVLIDGSGTVVDYAIGLDGARELMGTALGLIGG